jgi:hypothetical protein
MIDLGQQQVLRALFCLSRDTQRISALTLAAATGLTPTRAGEALVALERAGLVDASRARLTMRGLVLATRIKDSAKGGGGQRARAPEPKPAEKPITTPWAAGSEPPPAYY